MFSFGSGVLLGKRTDVANSTPVNFGLVQEVSLDFSFQVKELHGQYQFPVAVARGTGKISGKAKVARMSGLAFNHLFFGLTHATGQKTVAFGEAATIPTTPFQSTAANGATFLGDYGVVYSATGLPLIRVSSGPTTGQYSVNETTGVYTFAAADTGLAVLLNYYYTLAATGMQIPISNQLIGFTPTFSAVFYTTFQSKPATFVLNSAVSSKLGFGTKLDDFVLPDFEFQVQADSSGNIGTLSFGELS